MSWTRGRWTMVSMLLAAPVTFLALAVCALAQVVTTTVTDTIYRADGTPAGGTVVVSWPAFTTSTGQAVAAGSTSATIASNGVLTVQLTPNAGAMPMGTYYTAVYHLDNGSVNREYWVVPSSQTAVPISAIRSTVLPTSVAMQTVSKSYVDAAIAAAVTGHPLDSTNPYVQKAGDTMTGPLLLSGDPTSSVQAATKNYVDNNIVAVTGGLAQKVATLPSSTQTVTQPAGTQLSVNRQNGVAYASQYQDGRGGNGITNALASSDCVSGCEIKAEQNYDSTEVYTASTWNDGTHLEDKRGGGRRDTYLNPESKQFPGTEVGQVVSVVATRDASAIHQATATQNPASVGLAIEHTALAGGSNQFLQGNGTIPYFKMAYSALTVKGTYNTQGQHVLAPSEINCYGVGDCLIGSQFIYSSGGARDAADEGAHPFDLQIREDTHVFAGTCSTGCTTGSTSLTIAPTSGAGTQGDGRFLIDTTPAKVIRAGALIGQGAAGPNAAAAFSGTSFPLSTFFSIPASIPSQANNIAPGTVTVAIATTGLPSGFSANTAAAAASSGVACVADPTAQVNGIESFETANYTVVDGTHLQLTLNKAHYANATVAIGGLCGYGLEQTVDTASGIRQVFPVIGSYSSTGLYYAGGGTAIVGVMEKTSGFVNVSLPLTSAVRNNNTVTLTTAGNMPYDLNGLTLTVSGIADSSYNGSFTATTTGANTITYAQTGANSTSSGGTVSMLTGGYALYPMAEVLSVFNPATRMVDGQMKLAPNNVAWAANDTVEQPHYHQQQIGADLEFISQTVPRPTVFQQAGVQYEGNNGPGLHGWAVINASPATNYFGNGGTHTVPDVAYLSQGMWKRTMIAQAGEQSVFTIHCNSHGCGKWNSAYNLFELDANASADTVNFNPSTSALSFTLRGTSYNMTPQGFTAGTINATTVNATTINGAVAASQLPVFKASGAGHAQGVVPDPGATAGTTRYLREDGTWAAPATLAASATSLRTGVMADYDFMQGSGSALVDKSGSGNNGTLGSGANAPAWTDTGLAFALPQNVALPAALNTARTFYLAAYIKPLPTDAASYTYNQFPMLVGSSLGANGLNLLTYQQGDGGTWAFAPSIFAGGYSTTASTHLLAGFHIFAYTLGTGSGDPDHLYVDGVEDPTYTGQGWSAGLQTSGNLLLGASNAGLFGSSGLNGTMYRAVFLSGEDTAAQVKTTSAGILNDLRSRNGIDFTPPVTPTGKATLFAIGDSITYGLNVATSAAWPSNLSLANQPAYSVVNYGIPGATLSGILGSAPWREGTKCTSSSATPSVAIVFAGTNDIASTGIAPRSAFNAMAADIKALKQSGCVVFAATMLSRTGTNVDANKDAFDTLILEQAKLAGADGVVDFAANPLLGADGASANTTYFQSDAIHPTVAGHTLLAQAASNTLNYYFGYSLTNPNVVTASTYTLASGDGAVTAAPTANAAWTMPDCTGPSGATYTISNPQSAFTLTVAGQANQPINGLTTPVTIPPNATVTLRDVPNPKNVAGCHWVM